MTKAEIMVKPCPWCKRTPNVYLPIDNDWKDWTILGNESWRWSISCKGDPCKVRCSTYVTIRKKQKKKLSDCIAKLNLLATYWNANNPEIAYENVIVNLDKIKFESV